MFFMRLPPYEQALAACALLAGVDALIKAAAVDVSVLQIVNARYLVGTVVLLVVAGWSGAARLSRHEINTALFRGILFVMSGALFFHALAELPLATAVLLGFTAPIWITILSATILGEPLERTAAAAISVSFAGVALVAHSHLDADWALLADQSNMALLAGMAAPIVYAFATVGFKHRVTGSNFGGTMLVQTVAAALVSLPVWFMGTGPVSPLDTGYMVLIGVGATFGQLLYLHALSQGSTTRIAATEYTTLPWAFAFGMMFFSETPAGLEIMASLLIIASCFLGRKESCVVPEPVAKNQ